MKLSVTVRSVIQCTNILGVSSRYHLPSLMDQKLLGCYSETFLVSGNPFFAFPSPSHDKSQVELSNDLHLVEIRLRYEVGKSSRGPGIVLRIFDVGRVQRVAIMDLSG